MESPFQPLLLGGVNVTWSSVNGISSSQTSILSVLIHLVLSNKEWRGKGLTYFTSKQNWMMISNFFVVVAIILHRIDNVIMVCKKLWRWKECIICFYYPWIFYSCTSLIKNLQRATRIMRISMRNLCYACSKNELSFVNWSIFIF